jgi:hypothetical protein
MIDAHGRQRRDLRRPIVPDRIVPVEEFPVYINNRDRLTTVRATVNWLLQAGTQKIVILDNASTYPPLLEYYRDDLPKGVTVDYLGQNAGPWAFWDRHMHLQQRTPYIVTDSDLVPADECPKDLIHKLSALLKERPESGKVGPGLKIDDVPDAAGSGCGMATEKSYWTRRYNKEAFLANIDTTFALYPAGSDGKVGPWFDNENNLRMDSPYVMRHSPWYETVPLSVEEEYYREHSNKRWSHCTMPVSRTDAPPMKTSKVSVILTSYNRPKLIKEAVDSVLSQTYGNFEIIIADDGSNKETLETIARFKDERIVKLLLGRRELDGARYCHSINEALDVATGDLITHLADDDLYLPNRLQTMVNEFASHTNKWIVYGQQLVQEFDSRMSKVKEEIRQCVGITRHPQGHVDQHSFMYRAACLSYLGKPYWPTGNWWAGDTEFFARLVRYWDFFPISEVLDVHRFHPNSIQSLIMNNKVPVYEAEV